MVYYKVYYNTQNHQPELIMEKRRATTCFIGLLEMHSTGHKTGQWVNRALWNDGKTICPKCRKTDPVLPGIVEVDNMGKEYNKYSSQKLKAGRGAVGGGMAVGRRKRGEHAKTMSN